MHSLSLHATPLSTTFENLSEDACDVISNASDYTGHNNTESPDVPHTNKPLSQSLLLLERDARRFLDSRSLTDDRKIEGRGLTKRRNGGVDGGVTTPAVELQRMPSSSDVESTHLTQDRVKPYTEISDKSKYLLDGLKIQPREDSQSTESSGETSMTVTEDVGTTTLIHHQQLSLNTHHHHHHQPVSQPPQVSSSTQIETDKVSIVVFITNSKSSRLLHHKQNTALNLTVILEVEIL